MTPTTPTPGGGALLDASQNGHHRDQVYGPLGRSPWLDIDWREHQCWTIVDGQPINTVELGAGPPIVFVHGLSGSWPNWLLQLPEFAAEHRAIALDLPGFGYSPLPREPISISGYARLLDRFFDALSIDSAALVGNSMGGFISVELAHAFPQRVERLALVSPAGISSYHNPYATRALPTLRRLERIAAGYTAWLASKSTAATRRPRLREATLSLVTRHPGRLPAALAAEQLRGAGKAGFMPALEALTQYDFRERVPEVACPTLVVWGQDDRVISVRDADIYTELIPGSRKVVYEDTGHLAMLERPAAFNALLKEFLEE